MLCIVYPLGVTQKIQPDKISHRCYPCNKKKPHPTTRKVKSGASGIECMQKANSFSVDSRGITYINVRQSDPKGDSVRAKEYQISDLNQSLYILMGSPEGCYSCETFLLSKGKKRKINNKDFITCTDGRFC